MQNENSTPIILEKNETLSDYLEKGVVKFSDFKKNKSAEELLQDPFFRDDLCPITNIFKCLLPHYKLAAALAGYEIYISEFAINDSGNIRTNSVLIMVERNKEQDEESSNQHMYSTKMISKYKECMILSGVPQKRIYFPTYYGCVKEFYNEYVGKIDEGPFFEYVQGLIDEVPEPNRSNAKKILEEIMSANEHSKFKEKEQNDYSKDDYCK